MATLKGRKEVTSDLLRLGSQEPLPRTVLAELQRLPSARCLPPFLRLKRRDSDADAAAPASERAAPGPAPPAPPAWSSRPVTLDPTGLLLMEAANQLQELVEQQAQLRRLRRQRGGGSYVSDCDSGSEGGWEGAGGPRSLGADSISVASVSASGSCPASLESIGGTNLPLSRSLGRGSLAGHKRPQLERQYAIDLDGLCRVIGQRLPLPAPEEALG